MKKGLDNMSHCIFKDSIKSHFGDSFFGLCLHIVHTVPGFCLQAQSLYFSEKQGKKNIVLKDGQLVRRKKAQRKDKGVSTVHS